jgi:precorrin-6B methylase 2
VERIPEDAEARRERLAAWAADQERRAGPAAPAPRRVPHAMRRAWSQLFFLVTRWGDRIFDRGLGTADRETTAEHAHSDRVHYVPSPWHVLPRTLRYVRASSDDTFIDFGCGKGRVVHQAARWPLRRVIGVEISPTLAEQARSVVAAHAHQHKCSDVEIVVCDAAQYRVPDDVTIAYFFHPFGGETLDKVLRAIVESIDRRPRRVRMIYIVVAGEASVRATGRFRHVTDMRSGLPGMRLAIYEST